MKVAILCGGKGTRLAKLTEGMPKGLIPIGGRPIVWHVMKYFESFGHRDFVLLVGYRAGQFIDYFTPDATPGWTVTFVDSGPEASKSRRLKAAEAHLGGENAVCHRTSRSTTPTQVSIRPATPSARTSSPSRTIGWCTGWEPLEQRSWSTSSGCSAICSISELPWAPGTVALRVSRARHGDAARTGAPRGPAPVRGSPASRRARRHGRIPGRRTGLAPGGSPGRAGLLRWGGRRPPAPGSPRQRCR